LIPLLQTVGNHNVVRLTRPSSTVSYLDPLKSITWDPYNQNIDLKNMNGFDTIIHLGGVNIFGRWTKSKKEKN
jgi:NAD dependent epimerase/dehydratase family enzyme